jgi:hypothetical protein
MQEDAKTMNIQRTTRVDRLTAEDRELFGRIAYAMVVVGLWKTTVRRTDDSFDFFEVRGQQGQLSYRIGRVVDGGYVLFNLMTGARKHGANLADLLRSIAYVPRTS